MSGEGQQKSATWRQLSPQPIEDRAALTEAVRQVDVLYISLFGMAAIIAVLLFAVALPIMGYQPVKSFAAFLSMVFAAFVGIGYLVYQNVRVHQSVSRQSRLTEVLVNSLGQGFFTFDRNGMCGPVYSQACLELLDAEPAGEHVIELLRISATQKADFKDWLDILFMPNHALGFDDVIGFFPEFFESTRKRRIRLVYKPIRDKTGLLQHVVVIATDETEEHETQLKLKSQQTFVSMMCRIFKERNQFLATLAHVKKLIDVAEATRTKADATPLLRMLHTVKAALRYFHLEELEKIVSTLEHELRNQEIASDDDFRRRVGLGQAKIVAALQELKEQVRELVGRDFEGRGSVHEVEEDTIYRFAQELNSRHVDQALVRQFLTTIAAIPAFDCFQLFERQLLDLAEITGKQVKPVRFTGSNPRLLTRPLQDFLFSLTHLCRNIIDHGIESPVTRLARGKDQAGQVSVHADLFFDDPHQREMLHIVISDDGNGIDPSRIRAKLAAVDPQGPWRAEDDHAIIQRIFNWGFSTHDNVTDLSGRGVGMEAVEREVKLLGGEIRVYSELYRGTRFDIRLPYVMDLGHIDVPRHLAKTN